MSIAPTLVDALQRELSATPSFAAPALDYAEGFDGRGTNRAVARLDRALVRSSSKRSVRFNQGLIDQHGNPVVVSPTIRQQAGLQPSGAPKPDLSYLDANGRRVNIEFDSRTRSADQHLLVNNSDPNATNYALIIDRRTGRVIGGAVRAGAPAGGAATAERPLTTKEIRGMNSSRPIGANGLPRPQRLPAKSPNRGGVKRARYDASARKKYNIQREAELELSATFAPWSMVG
jgi:hypothetical protein